MRRAGWGCGMLSLVVLLAVTGAASAGRFSTVAQTVGSEVRDWSGELIDVIRTNCGPETERAVPEGVCPVSMRTTNFGLLLSGGKVVKFDEGGNTKALAALRRSRKGAKVVFDYWRTGKVAVPVRARATGALTSDTLNLDSIRVE